MLSLIAVSGRAFFSPSPSPIAFIRILEAPKPSRKRPSPAVSWLTRASIATVSGWRV